jgi:UDP-N-acetylmuramate: L-alanyl-gamma-D-glutamyl-meso-diaminopimelate ligase
LPGAHNRANALAAIAAARHVGVDPLVAIQALERFTGVRRRLQLRGVAGGIAVYDDFAHHPTAIRATLDAMRRELPGGRILAVFEPRSNTMRKGVMKEALPGSFAAADRVYVHTAGIDWNAEQVFASLAGRVCCEERLDRLIAAILAEARPGDRVLVMSNGSFGGIHDKLLAALDRR